MAKRFGLMLGAFALALLIATFSTWLYVGRRGSSELENWIGNHLVGVLGNYINPRVTFRSLDYQAPRTVVLEGLAFTAEGRPILQVDWARLELAEVPKRGKPILVQRIELNTPQMQFIVDGNDRLIGWPDFIKESVVEEPQAVPAGERLSDVLVLRHVGIQDGQVVFLEEGSRGDHMVLPGINLQLDTPPDQDDPEWHQLVATLKRDPLIDVKVDGRINLDTALLEIASLQLAASLSERQYATLPPALQNFLRQHEVKGALTASAQGQVPLYAPEQAKGTFQASLRDARVRYAGTAMPIAAVNVRANLPDGGIDLSVAGVNLTGVEHSFFSIGELEARLPGIPAENEPVVIERLRIDEPRLVFARNSAGGMKGWSQLAALGEPGQARTDDRGPDVAEVLRMFRLNRLEIERGSVTYAAPQSGEPVTIDGIAVALSGQPQTSNAQKLDLAGTLQAGSLVEGQLRGILDTGSAQLTVESFTASSELQPASYDKLPPKARDWVSAHQLRGRIDLHAEGSIPLDKPRDAKVTATAEITSAAGRFAGVNVPLEQAQLRLMMPEQRLEATLSNLQLAADDRPFLELPGAAATLTFSAEQGLVLQKLTLSDPVVSFIASADGGLLGWDRLAGDGTNTPSTSQGERESPIQIRQAKLENGTVRYASDRSAEATSIGGIGLTLGPVDKDAPGSPLRLEGAVDDDLVQAQLAGRLEIAKQQLHIDRLTAQAAVTAERYASLPQPVRQILAENHITGEVSITAGGSIPLDAPQTAKLDVQAQLANASLTREGMTIPVNQAQIAFSLPEGPFSASVNGVTLKHDNVTLAQADVVSGRSARLPWDGPLAFQQIRLEQPSFRFVQTRDGTLEGWSQLGERNTVPNGSRPDRGRQDDETSIPQVDQLEIAGARVLYEGPDANGPIILDGLNATLTTNAPGQGEGITFAGSLRQPELLNAEFEGHYDPTTPALAFSKLTAHATLDNAASANLPKAMRDSLQRHQLQGDIVASWKGSVALGDHIRPEGHLELKVNNAKVLYAGAVWPIGRLHLQADLPTGPITATGQELAINAGKVQIFSAAGLDVKIPQLPGNDKPLRIEHLMLDEPRVVLVPADDSDGLQGWDAFLADNEAQSDPPDSAEPRRAPASDPLPIIDKLRVKDGEIVYAAAPGDAVMVLPGLDLNASSSSGGPSYEIVGRINRPGFMEMNLEGQLDAAERTLDLQTFSLRGEFNEQQYQTLPPSVQETVRRHEITGSFTVNASGRIPLDALDQAQGQMSATVRNARFAYDETQWPIQQLSLNARAANGTLSARLEAAMLDGNVRANARAALSQARNFELDWQISGVQIDKMMRAAQQADSTYAGTLTSQGNVRGRLDAIPASLSGSGELSVANGRLLRLPIIQGVVARLVSIPLGLRTREDRASATWDFGPQAIRVKEMAVASPLLAIEGTGRLFYDQRVDLSLRATPLQNPAPRLLGEIGNLIEDIGKLSSNIVTYEVSGTLSDPSVVPAPLGITGK